MIEDMANIVEEYAGRRRLVLRNRQNSLESVFETEHNLREHLTEEEQKLLTDYADRILAIEDERAAAFFKDGFCLAMEIMLCIERNSY